MPPTALLLNGSTTDGQILSVTLPAALANVRYIRVLTTNSQSWVAWGPVNFSFSSVSLVVPASQTPAILLGYYMADLVGYGDYLSEVSQLNNNIAFIWENDATDVLAKVQEASAHGLKSIIFLRPFLFPASSSELYPDYQSRFDTPQDEPWDLLLIKCWASS